MWLDATRVSTAPGKGVSRQTGSPVVTAASARVVENPERRHRLADDVFAQDRPERRASVALPGKRRWARSLELDVAAHAVAIDHLAEKNGTSVTELRYESPNWWPA